MVSRLLRLIGREPAPAWDLSRLYRGWDDPALEADLRGPPDALRRAVAYADLRAAADGRQRDRADRVRRRALERAGPVARIETFEDRLARDRMEPGTARALISAVEAAFPPTVPAAPLPGRTIRWSRARDLAVRTQEELSPACGAAARRLFDEWRIDARPSGLKARGAQAYPVAGGGFILMSWRGRIEDALILAHEVGHGVHQALSAGAGEPSRALAEMVAALADRRALARLEADGLDAGPFRAEAARLNLAAQRDRLKAEQAGGAAAEAPFAGLAYLFGRLAAQALDRVRAADPIRFAPLWDDLLGAGERAGCEAALAAFGLDARDPDLWRREAISAAGLSRAEPPL